jgi:imidazole glycerol phosphate synthase subunit HisF
VPFVQAPTRLASTLRLWRIQRYSPRAHTDSVRNASWQVLMRSAMATVGSFIHEVGVLRHRECVHRGAGELLVTSIDRDGARTGYDLELTAAIADAVDVPVIASGGAGSAAHVRDAIEVGHADAALVAGILHEGITTVRQIKSELARNGISVRAA